jgi:hypothetical protein
MRHLAGRIYDVGTLGSLIVRIAADTKDLEDGVERSTGVVSRAAGVLGSLGKAAGLAAVGGLVAVSVAVGATVASLPKLIEMGSDAEEMMGKFNVVFGDAANGTIKNLDAMTTEMGRSKYEARGFAAAFQDTFVPLGFSRNKAAELSTQLTQLTYDVASFDNSLEPDVMRDFQSALVGNHETVRKYGIVITEVTLGQELMRMGIAGGTKAATEQEKVQARLNLIMAGTSDAQGDAVRTGGSWANQMRALRSTVSDLATDIGGKLLTVFTPLLSSVRKFVQDHGPALVDIINNRIIPAVVGVAEKIKNFALYGVAAVQGLLDILVRGQTPFGDWDIWMENMGFGMGGLADTFATFISKVGTWASIIKAAFDDRGVVGALDALRILISDQVALIWPVVWAEVSTWPGRFWEWLTSTTAGVMAFLTPRMNALATSMVEWATSKETIKTMEGLGTSLVGTITGIFGSDKSGASAVGDKTSGFAGAMLRMIAGATVALESIGIEIGKGIISGIVTQLTSDETKLKVNSAIWAAFPEWLSEGIIKGDLGTWLADKLQSYDSGGVVPGAIGGPAQLAYVHPGETIYPAGTAGTAGQTQQTNNYFNQTINTRATTDDTARGFYMMQYLARAYQ